MSKGNTTFTLTLPDVYSFTLHCCRTLHRYTQFLTLYIKMKVTFRIALVVWNHDTSWIVELALFRWPCKSKIFLRPLRCAWLMIMPDMVYAPYIPYDVDEESPDFSPPPRSSVSFVFHELLSVPQSLRTTLATSIGHIGYEYLCYMP